jgi:hypothetical protein
VGVGLTGVYLSADTPHQVTANQLHFFNEVHTTDYFELKEYIWKIYRVYCLSSRVRDISTSTNLKHQPGRLGFSRWPPRNTCTPSQPITTAPSLMFLQLQTHAHFTPHTINRNLTQTWKCVLSPPLPPPTKTHNNHSLPPHP